MDISGVGLACIKALIQQNEQLENSLLKQQQLIKLLQKEMEAFKRK
jgi:hypothetical protein